MNDTSLRFQPRNYQVALEAVSPVMMQFQELKKQIDLFWEAMTELFDIETNTSCGTHVHVAPRDHGYTLEELRRLAYAVATEEKFVLQILPQERIDNHYCRPCSFRSEELRLDLQEGEEDNIEHPSSYVAERLRGIRNESELIDYMQSNNRYVLWNFKNTQSQSGTVEFRGGRHMRGPVRTKRWIAFTVAFVNKAIEESGMYDRTVESDIDEWWQNIRSRAKSMRMDEFLPGTWQRMRDIVR
ncbi:hypothetical protein NCS52_01247900 [Fusarium sp. LHS14.1]|nr:hypothetical protein NCS52_01247900 [Fusarium sp. LHS14.1]